MTVTRSQALDGPAATAAREPSGSDGGFDALVDNHWEAVMRFLWLRLSAEDARDMAQDVFLRAWRAHRSGGGPDEDRPRIWRAYLLRTARNLWIDDARSRGTRVEATSLDGFLNEESSWEECVVQDGAGGTDEADTLIERETRLALVECLGHLDTDLRQVFWLHFVEGRAKRDIARGLNCPESSLRLGMVKGMSTLRSCLEEKGEAPERTR